MNGQYLLSPTNLNNNYEDQSESENNSKTTTKERDWVTAHREYTSIDKLTS